MKAEVMTKEPEGKIHVPLYETVDTVETISLVSSRMYRTVLMIQNTAQ